MGDRARTACRSKRLSHARTEADSGVRCRALYAQLGAFEDAHGSNKCCRGPPLHPCPWGARPSAAHTSPTRPRG
jgi:hypothetical protein